MNLPSVILSLRFHLIRHLINYSGKISQISVQDLMEIMTWTWSLLISMTTKYCGMPMTGKELYYQGMIASVTRPGRYECSTLKMQTN